jgi:hypothetical protein
MENNTEMTEKECVKLAVSILQCFEQAYLYNEYKQNTPFTDEQYHKIIDVLQNVSNKME